MAFRLRKWYLDAIDPHGNTFIGYWASVQWGWLHLHYTASLRLLSDGILQTSSSFRREPEPVEHQDSVTWHADQWRGTWTGTMAGVSQQLFSNQHGTVDWHCLQPHATVTLQWPGSELQGLGYVERLEMTVPPWKLPIDELRWGRWLAEQYSLVWIEWKSATHPRQLAWLDGRPVPLQSVDEREVVVEGATLALHHPVDIRQGVLGQTVFPRWWSWLLPRRLRQMRETKWRAAGILSNSSNSSTATGWAIHEVVHWQ